MVTLQKFALVLPLATALAAAAGTTPNAFARKHLGVSLTGTDGLAPKEPKRGPIAQESAAYVVFGSSLMSLGLLFTHIRQRPRSRMTHRKA